jgi:hypothetical protein
MYNKYDTHERNCITYVVSILKHARLIFIIRPKFFFILLVYLNILELLFLYGKVGVAFHYPPWYHLTGIAICTSVMHTFPIVIKQCSYTKERCNPLGTLTINNRIPTYVCYLKNTLYTVLR